MSPPITTRAIADADLAEIARLHARAFGPGRFARSAYRVREGSAPISPYCRVALLGNRIEARIGATGGALLLGPLAVDPDHVNQGLGRRLIGEALEAARAGGIRLVVLVGDAPYYGRFGFAPVPRGQIALPGPVDPARILALELVPGTLADYRGLVSAEG
jgi:predicted N-acetyltransferase YhbS